MISWFISHILPVSNIFLRAISVAIYACCKYSNCCQLLLIHHTKNEEDHQVIDKGQSINANNKMTEMLILSDKDFKAAIINMLLQLHACLKQV